MEAFSTASAARAGARRGRQRTNLLDEQTLVDASHGPNVSRCPPPARAQVSEVDQVTMFAVRKLEVHRTADLDEAQRDAVDATEGPVLLIAGPGAGKTLTLVRRTLNILLRGLQSPRRSCCARSPRRRPSSCDRLRSQPPRPATTAISAGSERDDPRSLQRVRGPLPPPDAARAGYEVLDELTQLLFIFEHFDEIVGSRTTTGPVSRAAGGPVDGHRGRSAATSTRSPRSSSTRRSSLASRRSVPRSARRAPTGATRRLSRRRTASTSPTFSASFSTLLDDPDVGRRVAAGDPLRPGRRVPGHQLRPGAAPDAAHARRHGTSASSATRTRACTGSAARPSGTSSSSRRRFPDCDAGQADDQLPLARADRRALRPLDGLGRLVEPAGGPPFRFDKTIEPDPDGEFPDYPAVFCIWGTRRRATKAKRFADLVAFLKENGVIEDYSQVALLLHSVRESTAGRTSTRSSEQGIPAFCPRARGYFENEEIRLMVACFALLLGWHGDGRGEIDGPQRSPSSHATWTSAIVELGARYRGSAPARPSGCRRSSARSTRSTRARASTCGPPTTSTSCLALEPFAAACGTRTAPATSRSSRSS